MPKPQSSGAPAHFPWSQQFLVFALFFAGLVLAHAPLLRLPYFWDEAGYYVPVAHDLYLTGSPIPFSTPSNAHPPLIMAWLALIWHIFGYSVLVTRLAMLFVAAFSLLGLFRFSRFATNLSLAWVVVALVAAYPVFFVQSSLAQVDLPAAGFTFWALLAYLEEHPGEMGLWFSAAALAKETAIMVPLALFGWHVLTSFLPAQWKRLRVPAARRIRLLHLLIPVVPLAAWFAYHRLKTGFFLGNPDFFRYNVSFTLNPLRIPLAFVVRLWQTFGYMGLYVLSIATLLAMLNSLRAREKATCALIAPWQQSAFAFLLFAYLLFVSAVGGAVLARYLLPVLPVFILMAVSKLAEHMRYWKLVVAAIAMAFIGALFSSPPYAFSLEDNLAYRDYIVMHVDAARFLAMREPDARVLTAWPASDELSRPGLGYVNQPFSVVRIEDFTTAQIEHATAGRNNFDVALVFSTKYVPARPLFEEWNFWQRAKESFFGYHRDLKPNDIAQRMGGQIVFHKESSGQWIAVINFR